MFLYVVLVVVCEDKSIIGIHCHNCNTKYGSHYNNSTILWTGNGYHIYQPLNGIVFEEEQIFYDFLPYLDGRDLTTEFLRFVEKLFTNKKADPQHSPSVKSCLVRLPGTFNSKNNEKVKIIQRWNGKRPPIQPITREFLHYLIQKRNGKRTETKSKIWQS